jgi:hypothetical protein
MEEILVFSQYAKFVMITMSFVKYFQLVMNRDKLSSRHLGSRNKFFMSSPLTA